LDEIGEVSIPAQIKLLRVLQERTFTPVGAERARRFEGRVVAATHRSLVELRAEGRFRDDFYYRLCSDVVELPSLQQRFREAPAELSALLPVLVERIVGSPDRSLIGEVEEAIARDLPEDYPWPGNVRELEQTVRRVLLTGRCSPDPRAGGSTTTDERFWLKADNGALDAKELLAGYCALLYARLGTYEKVAQVTGLDRRTVKKNVLIGDELV
ncbi:MAG: sigma 54-interacting transcriptional regulator, partial [Planctomycetota bacterium]